MAPRVHFFSLPREIRDQIYELSMLDYLKAAPVDKILHAQWLLASKQIYFEAAGLAYGRTCFFTRVDLTTTKPLVYVLEMKYVFGNAPVNLLPAMQTFHHAKTLIRSLAVHLDFKDLEDARPIGKKVAQYFHGLDTLSGLLTLYVSFGPQLGLLRCFAHEWSHFSQGHLSFGPALTQAVATLKSLVPPGCRIFWSIPPEICSYELRTVLRYDMTPEGWIRKHIEDTMKAISDSIDATNGGPRDVLFSSTDYSLRGLRAPSLFGTVWLAAPGSQDSHFIGHHCISGGDLRIRTDTFTVNPALLPLGHP